MNLLSQAEIEAALSGEDFEYFEEPKTTETSKKAKGISFVDIETEPQKINQTGKSFNKTSYAIFRESLFNPNVMESVSAQNALNKSKRVTGEDFGYFEKPKKFNQTGKSFNKASDAIIRERLFNPNVMESVSAQNALRKYRAQEKTNSKMSKYYEKKTHVLKEAELNKTFSGQEKESLIKKNVKKSIDELERRKKAKASGFIGSDGRFVVPKKYEKRFKDGYIDKYGQRTDKSYKRINDYLLERQNRPINNSAKKTAEEVAENMSEATKGVAGEVTKGKGFFKSVGKHKGKLGVAAAVVGTAVAMNAITPKYDIPLDNLPASQRKQKLQDLMEIQKSMQSGVY